MDRTDATLAQGTLVPCHLDINQFRRPTNMFIMSIWCTLRRLSGSRRLLPVSEGRRVSASSKPPEMERWRDGWGRSQMVGVVVELEVKAPVYSALLHRPAVGRGRQRPALEIQACQDSTIALFWSAQPLTNQDRQPCWEQTLLFFLFCLHLSSPYFPLVLCIPKNIFIETSSPPPARPLPPNIA